MPAEEIEYSDKLRDGTDKINAAIRAANLAEVNANNAVSTADNANTTAILAKDKSDSTQTQLNAIVVDGDSSVEAAQARVDADGVAYATLKERLDGENNSVTSQLSQNKRQVGSSDIYNPKGNVSAKAIYNSLGTVFVVTPKPHGNGYVRVALREGVVTNTESAGLPAELRRPTTVDNVLDCFVMKVAEFANSSSSNWITSSVNYVLPTGEVQALETRQIGTRVIGAWIEYEVDIPTGVNAVEFLIYGTSGSSTDVNVSVDGAITLAAQSFVKSSQWFSLAIPVIPGKRKIRFTTNTSSYMTFAGAYLKLKDFKKGFTFDKVTTFHQGVNKYVSANGAWDYALYDSDASRWVGSYHGGETRSRLLYVLDGQPITINENTFHVGNVFEIEQDTNIVNKILAYSRQRFEMNGSIEHEVIFEGNINLTKMFTNMSTTADSFNDIIYPKRHTLVDEGNYYLPQGINYVVQRDSSNNQKVITILNNNMFPASKDPTPYIKKTTGAYNKVYNPNIDSATPVNFTAGNFKSVHVFE